VTARGSHAPRFTVTSLECHERPVTLRLPFRFGAATVREAPQAFVRATIRATDGRTAHGMAAEMMIPKWFDKDPRRSNAENVEDLRRSLRLARAAYCADTAPRSAFGHASFHYQALLESGAQNALNALCVSYGAALADRAILDALCRLRDVGFAPAMRLNLAGVDAALTGDLAHCDLDAFLSTLAMPRRIEARHTVGMADPLTERDLGTASFPDDGLPVTLTQVIARYRNRWFKLKLCGEVDADIARLCAIAAVLDTLSGYRVTLDGNEQFADAATVAAFIDALAGEPRLTRLRHATLYLEQPLPRSIALDTDVHGLAAAVPLIIDESDATLDAFPQARARGYAGVSSKSCKGVYKSLLNAARCASWNAGRDGATAFMTGEDLTAQPGLAVQQDLALAALIGLSHVERNGHHYAAGFAGQHAPIAEQQAFLAAHQGLYECTGDRVALAIRDGAIALDSLAGVGFASGAWPDVESMQPIGEMGSEPIDSASQTFGLPI
jgi:hypothetical protein